MPFSINPLTFSSMRIATNAQQANFMAQLAQFLNQVTTQILALQASTAGTSTTQALGAQGSNFAFNAKGASIVAISFSFSANVQLTINGLAEGSIFSMRISNTAGVAHTLTMAANDVSNNVYSPITLDNASGSFNMVSGGLSVAGSGAYNVMGFSMSGPALYLLAL